MLLLSWILGGRDFCFANHFFRRAALRGFDAVGKIFVELAIGIFMVNTSKMGWKKYRKLGLSSNVK